MPQSNLPRFRPIAIFVCAVSTPLFSQEQQGNEEVFDLPAFEVSTAEDRGYLSTNTTSGTSLNTTVRDLPMGLEILNQEFIEDLQATDFKEALDYSAGVFLDTFENTSNVNQAPTRDRSPSSSVDVGNPFANAISIRGYAVPNQQRLGFRVGTIVPAYGVVLGGITDTANTMRQEVVRGPQSLLYGINVLSGIVNIIPKKPLPEERYSTQVSFGSNDFFRTVGDATGPIIEDRLNYRIVGSYTEIGDWTDYQEDTRKFIAGQAEWFITPKAKIFFELQYSNSRRDGGGEKFFRDTGRIDAKDFVNEFDERYTFGRDFFNQEEITDPAFKGKEDEFGPIFGRKQLIQKPGKDYTFPDLGPEFRITGPDQFHDSKEFNALMLTNIEVVKNMDLELGAYYTDLEIDRRVVDIGVFQSALGRINPSLKGRLGYRFDPEANFNFETGQVEDPIGFGPGELFIGESPKRDLQGVTTTDRKFGRYYWFKQPTSAETIQLRARLAYSFETNHFDNRIPIDHTLTGGIQYIRDEVSFVRNNLRTTEDNVYSAGSQNEDFTNGRNAEDPFFFRNIFDYSVMRYNGEEYAYTGRVSRTNLPGVTVADDTHYIARSGWINADLFYRGAYFVYHGKLWEDRLNIIAGLRRDEYQVREEELLRVIDNDRETDNWQGSGEFVIADAFAGTGERPYQWNPELPDSLNAKVERSVAAFREERPNGTREYNFDDFQEFTTKTFGLSYRITDPLSIYYLYSEGVFPNTGQRDGANRPIGAEQTTNNEIGLKFEFIDGKISGTVSVYEIKRENAVWNWPFAPAPAKWFGGANFPGDKAGEDGTFNPQLIDDGELTLNYGVDEKYVRQAYEELGLELPQRRGNIDGQALRSLGVVNIEQRGNGDSSSSDPVSIYVFADYHKMVSVPDNPIQRAFDLAMADRDSFSNPFQYSTSDLEEAHNPSGNRSSGANVLYEEKGVGIDGQLIFSPLSNYQIIFSFSQQEREVTGSGFTLAPGFRIDDDGNPIDDQLWTTEYDRWVFQLGPENFEDPRDPTTLKSGAIEGLDLSFVPKYSFRLWNKYQFTEGVVQGLEVGGGVRVNGPVPTAVAVGGTDLAVNRFLTPDIPERYIFDLFLSYRTEFWGKSWRFALKVNNLLDDTVSEAVAEYEGFDGEPVFRRTRIFHAPRSFRFSVSMKF